MEIPVYPMLSISEFNFNESHVAMNILSFKTTTKPFWYYGGPHYEIHCNVEYVERRHGDDVEICQAAPPDWEWK